MFSDICNQYSGFNFSDKNKPEGKIFLLSDTILTQGNFLISGIINFYIQDGEDGLVFLGLLNNYAHYQAVSRKMGFNIDSAIKSESFTYIDGFNRVLDWIPEDLPYTEATTNSWVPLPKNTVSFTLKEEKEKESLSDLIKTIEKSLNNKKGRRAILIDNLNILEGITREKGALLSFLQSLCLKVKEENVSLFIMLTKDEDNEHIRKLLAVLEMNADYHLEIAENSGGYSRDIIGQLVISSKSQPDRTQQKYLLNSKENWVTIQNYLKI